MESDARNIGRKPNATRFLPDFCRPAMLFGVVLTGQLLVFTLALHSDNRFDGLLARLGPLIVFMLVLSLGPRAP